MCNRFVENNSYAATAEPDSPVSVVSRCEISVIGKHRLDSSSVGSRDVVPFLPYCGKRRRVSFGESSSSTTVQSRSTLLTDQDRSNMWWCAEEQRNICRKARLAAHIHRKSNAEHVAHFNDTFLRESTSAKTLKNSGLVTTKTTESHRRSVRGLERQVYTVLSKHRSGFVSGVLDVQAKIPANVSDEMRARILCAKSMQMSKSSRAFARVLAWQDSVEVASIVTEELGGSEERR